MDVEAVVVAAAAAKGTRFAKLSFAGVAGFDGGAGPLKGVDLPETGGVGRRALKEDVDSKFKGFLAAAAELEVVQSNPDRSSILTPDADIKIRECGQSGDC